MFPYPVQDDHGTKPLSEDDHQILAGLVHRNGLSSIMYALTGFGESSRGSMLSTNTFLSSTSASASAPSLAWTNSEVASQCRSDGASIHTQYTWPEVVADMPPMHDTEAGKLCERSWLDSPAPVPSEGSSHPSPPLIVPTGKKYQCPMCYLDISPVGFGRKSDFKKHLHNFHGADVVWICWTKGCNLSFSTERAYSTHAKEAHRMKALPNSTARTVLCPQLVFSCGFAECRDRVFEAASAEESAQTRDKHFEHIAKHFEDGYDISTWEYKVQIQNLLRQQQVKPIWKTCIWPKEKRQQLTWKPRSSGDLKRILESRHLGSDISNLVRLAFILGNAPFTQSGTPPPCELETYFQMPYRNSCPVDRAIPSPVASPLKAEDDSSSTFTLGKYRSSTQTVFRLSSRNSKRASRPASPVDAEVTNDTVMGEDMTTEPHPGTPFPIPNETLWPADAPKFAPEPTALPKQITNSVENHTLYSIHGQEQTYNNWNGIIHAPVMEHDIHHVHGMPSVMDGMHFPTHPQHMITSQPMPQPGLYNYAMNASQTSTVRPGTPVPHKRPGSWSRVMSMETLRPSKKMSATSMNSQPSYQDMSEVIPSSMGM